MDKEQIKKLKEQIRKNGVQCFLAPPRNGQPQALNQAQLRLMIERNLPLLEKAKKAENFFEIVNEGL